MQRGGRLAFELDPSRVHAPVREPAHARLDRGDVTGRGSRHHDAVEVGVGRSSAIEHVRAAAGLDSRHDLRVGAHRARSFRS